MSNEQTYNGYSNYETWCVNLWLTNDEMTYRHWVHQARYRRDEAEDLVMARDGILTVDEAARQRLGEDMKEAFEENTPEMGPSAYSDLLNAVLTEVDWCEIAESFLEDLGPPQVEGDE